MFPRALSLMIKIFRRFRGNSGSSVNEPVLKLDKRSYSQAGQESFVLNATRFKKHGYYVEIGAFNSKILSNTFILESLFNWSGVSFEISTIHAEEFGSERINPVFNVDATKCDYKQILDSVGAPNVIDYLQVDIEPARNTFKALRRILRTDYRFLTVTFEHDLYRSIKNLCYKQLGYLVLSTKGYKRVASNVCDSSLPFEDWYVHRSKLATFPILPSNCDWTSFFGEGESSFK